MIAPYDIRQVSPITYFRRGFIKAHKGLVIRFEFDIVGEPKVPLRSLLALVPADQLNSEDLAKSFFDPSLELWQLESEVNDRYVVEVEFDNTGLYYPVLCAWTDEVDRLIGLAAKKRSVGDTFDLEIQDIATYLKGQLLDEELINFATFMLESNEESVLNRRLAIEELISVLEGGEDVESKLSHLLVEQSTFMAHLPRRLSLLTTFKCQGVYVEDQRSAFSSWYEVFPRSVGGLRGVIELLPKVSRLGFDTLYLPPIHPIGHTNRKGPNNAVIAAEGDVGSPWAIGSSFGGHTAIEPSIGTLADFDYLIARAREANIDVALDIALQCSPDHPWVREHPDWFVTRSNGEIAYAENPPKKYQDIYPIYFFADDDDRALQQWATIYEVLVFWIERGVRTFRVDNPHTKPLSFWRYVANRLRRECPGVVMLAEAFTMPKLMIALGELGYSMSYSYFTWRNSKWELIEYGKELSSVEYASSMRANFWPNTPDILPDNLREKPLSSFAIRATLAATMVGSWGIYSGFEFGENKAVKEDSEEYLDSEKYQIVVRDHMQSAPLEGLISQLNEFRRRNIGAISNGYSFVEVPTDSDAILAFLRRDSCVDRAILVVVNLDPNNVSQCMMELWPIRRSMALDGDFEVFDYFTGALYSWSGDRSYIRLDPTVQPAHLFEISI
ncbi:MAG: alpha-amylase family glycosyl hydrolase [Actinomycetota bacterium]|nr:alpha-amylase family glycosyl hydrolase [Actinomycetota bacterium]